MGIGDHLFRKSEMPPVNNAHMISQLEEDKGDLADCLRKAADDYIKIFVSASKYLPFERTYHLYIDRSTFTWRPKESKYFYSIA